MRLFACLSVVLLALGCSSPAPSSTPPDDAPAKDLPDDLPEDDLPPLDAAPPDASSDASSDASPADAHVEDLVAPCGAGELRCGDSCIDPRANNAHCGACDNPCAPEQTCRNSVCATEGACPPGQMRCGGRCVDVAGSDTDCGACGNACPAGRRCVAGACVTPATCPPGQTLCGGRCVDTATDANHCGRCDTTCPVGQSCAAGACAATTTCPAGQSPCAGECVDTATDVDHCGRCGNACPGAQVCAAGACRTVTCPAGQSLCGGACVDVSASPTHCGACGRACAAGQRCAAGVCVGAAPCPTGQARCGEACADLAVDPAHCGACGRACAAAQVCAAGQCRASRPPCAAGTTDCAPASAAPLCVDVTSSAAHCGACGSACAAGLSCVSGACACAAPLTLCGRACVNTRTDAAHCGACGRACAAGQACAAGACACPAGQALCGGACVSTTTDRAHCGACGRACAAGQACVAGACQCAAGQALCSGACVSTSADPAHCGACGRACGAGQACVAGVCQCAAGRASCGGQCVDTATSAAHCGRCGNACPLATSCVGGACVGRPPANDTRAGATAIDLTTPARTLSVDTTAARHDVDGPCACTTGNDVFYRFTLTRPEVVYADTLGAAWDTSLFLLDAEGRPVVARETCNDDASDAGLCPGLAGAHSMLATRLGPGTWYLAVSGCGAGRAELHFQHLPAGSGAVSRIAPSAAVQTVTGATATGTGTVTSSCCSGSTESVHWWVTCPGGAATTFQATTCDAAGRDTATWDVSLAQYSALRPSPAVCNDDVLGTCGTGSSLLATLPATSATQASLEALVVDGCAGAGTYAVRYVLANCATGTRCGAQCVDTARDPAHCGGCDRRCSAGSACVDGQCLAPPSNDRPSGAVVIDTARPSSTYFVNTFAASHDVAGPCGCASGRDVFYAFTLTQPEVVYADTLGSSFDTALFLEARDGGPPARLTLPAGSATPYTTTCNDDGGLFGCATGTRSQVLAPLPAGSYRLVLSGCGAGNAVLHFQHVPVGGGALRFLPQGSAVLAGATAGVGRVASACCSDGPEDTWYWYTCPGFAGGSFTATTCGRATWDTALEQRSATRLSPGAGVCNDDACGAPLPRQSSLASAVPAGAGLHALYVDGCRGASGDYTAAVVRP